MSIRGAERSEGIARRAEQAVQRCTAERRKPFGGNLAEGDPKDAPEVIAQSVVDVDDLPAEGEERTVTVPLIPPLTGRSIGFSTLFLKA